MRLGYARVSTNDQNLDLQIDALVQAGCEEIFQEKASGAKMKNRPELLKLLAYARKGDVVIIWKLDRLGRSISDLIKIVNQLKGKGVEFISLKDNFDTCTPGGKLIFHIMAALSEFERDMISERTKAGLKSARARGRMGGRPRGLTPRLKAIAPAVWACFKSEEMTNKQMSKHFGIAVGSIYNIVDYMRKLKQEQADKLN